MPQPIADNEFKTNHKPLIDNIVVEHGPHDLLGRFFLEADDISRRVGVIPTLGTFEELVQINKDNADNWVPMIPLFDPANGALPPQTAICIIGRNVHGEAVAAHAVRLYSWPDTTFKEEAESYRLFYADPDRMRLPDERCIVSSRLAAETTGRVAYSGAAWVRPDYRGRALARIFPRLAKAYAYTLWGPDVIVSWMTEATYGKGLLQHVGYTSMDWAVDLENSFIGDLRFAFLTMHRPCLLDYIRSFPSAAIRAKIDAAVSQRRAHQP